MPFLSCTVALHPTQRHRGLHASPSLPTPPATSPSHPAGQLAVAQAELQSHQCAWITVAYLMHRACIDHGILTHPEQLLGFLNLMAQDAGLFQVMMGWVSW